MGSFYGKVMNLGILPCLVAITLVFSVLPVAGANAETRKLKLYYLHTGERAEIAYKKNGKYIKGGLRKINRFLRDWRRNEPTKMNPRLLDLVWEVYKETGSRKYIHVISGYRSPATNNLLRKRGRGVAKKSQHTLGNALDFFIPGVSLRKLRNIGLRKGIGGVGFYPKSGSPFVHMDTGRVRHWPRMSRSQLVKVFPRGKTLHVPSDGKPLPGYNIAKANYERTIKGQGKIKIASAEEIRKKPSILAKLFSRDDDEEAGIAGATSAPKPVKAITVKPAEARTTPEAPAPAAPEPEQTPETILASLNPKQIPVPVLAPRIAVVKPPEPELVPEPENTGTQIASLTAETETVIEDGNPSDDSLAVPVPVPRPSIALALDAEKDEQPVQVAALSSNEISELRQQVYAALESDAQQLALASAPEKPEPETIPFKPATPIDDTIPFKPATQVEESIPFRPPTKLAASDIPSLIYSAPQAIETQTASIEPLEPEVKTSGGIAIPSSKPEAEPQLVAALLPLEPDLKKTGNISVPSPSPVEPTVVEETSVTAASSIPVPQPALRPTKVAAAIEAPTPAPKTQDNNGISSLSLEEFKTANLDERLTGKWALATDASIKDIADIRPPAYGRNILRELPSTVLSGGFSQSQIGSITNSFTGSSVEFLDFRRFK